ncbi:MTAP family purine nucleoside phosphorylase [Aliikangiella coralliicola]|uniref:Purine nucleoside phosphorylase n=1 Tax=Aliikangiella coralliicola TaxID=2592383 RepID=A0A545UF76_9GAMM|nr:MTAP family purine nucleoside phosphorylase [Aliikangiella coralliicola]TQV88131.1 MTAP family purine nucleoside phosphorylase [Aliikangiella coralliicola]
MLAIIGGTGLYKIDELDIKDSIEVSTPFGMPSANAVKGNYKGRDVLFLPRHGNAHQLLPSEINYKANIWALKSLGATQIIGVSAVGSLREEIRPGDLSIPSQYFDFVKGNREKSFFGNGLVAHVSTANPICHSMADDIVKAANTIDIPIHQGQSYAGVDGPRLGTRVESQFLRESCQCDLVGMTNVPEVFLAREAQISYCTITIATDYDCWKDDPADHVTVEKVIQRFGESLAKAQKVLMAYLLTNTTDCVDGCRSSLASAILSPRDLLNEEQSRLLELLEK